jgi:hypothetical protein
MKSGSEIFVSKPPMFHDRNEKEFFEEVIVVSP